MANHVLAVRIGLWQVLGNGAISTGYRVMLSVQNVHMDLQTTTFYGQNLYQGMGSGYGQGNVDTGSLDAPTLFRQFCFQYQNRCAEWAELDGIPPNPLLTTTPLFITTSIPPDQPLSAGEMTLLDAGYDPMKGWYIKFQGNFGINIPIFQGYPSVSGGPADYSIKIS